MHNRTSTEYWFEAKRLAAQRRKRGNPQYPTGLAFIDEATDGLHPGEIWIVAGKSGSGKTTLALQMATSFADNSKHSVLFSSLEMKGWELTTRIYCSMFGIDFNQFVRGYLDQGFEYRDKKFQEYLLAIDFQIAEFAGYNFYEIETILKQGYNKKKLDVLFIDFIQLVDSGKARDERHAIMDYIKRLKELSKRTQVGVVIVSQLRRLPSGSNYNKEPDISDLLGTGSLEQTADKILLVYKAEDTETNSIIHFINLAKNRQGPTTKKQVIFEGKHYRFREIEEIEELKRIKDKFDGSF